MDAPALKFAIVTSVVLMYCQQRREIAAKEPAPSYSEQTIIPAGSGQAAPLAPGMILSVYGKQLGPKTGCTGRPDSQHTETPSPLRPNQTVLERQLFPPRLCQTEVRVGGIPAGLLYVQAGQINFKVPQEISIQGTTTVQVTYNGQSGPVVRQTLGGAATESSEQLAEEIWSALQKVRWETPYLPSRHPDLILCRAVAPHPDLRSGFYGYEFYCSEPSSGVVAESFFFPENGRPPASLLRQADFRLAHPYPAMSLEVEQFLKARITKQYGTGKVPDDIFEIGMGGPEPGLTWEAGETTIFLSHNRNYAAPAGVREGVLLVAVRKPILTERNLKRELEKSFGFFTKLAGPVIAADLAQDLGTSYLVASKIPETEPERAPAEHQVTLHLLALLRHSGEGFRELRAAKLVAADDLAVRLGSLLMLRRVDKGSEVLSESSTAKQVRNELAPFHIHYTGPGHDSGDLEYDRSLLKRAWKEFPETPWGQRAFLMRQRLSCELNGDFPGPEQFRVVIREGELFLRTYPDSPFRREALYHLALAYDTWWSVSDAPRDDPTAEGATVDKVSGERARVKAIALYEEIFRLAPASAEAHAGQMVLPRLKLKFPTGERTFFCISD